MTDFLSQVTPLTRGIVWLCKHEATGLSSYYKVIDYLLDGLLTASFESHRPANGLLVGKNFGKDFYVFVSNQELIASEVLSFFTLVSPVLGSEEDLLIVDERNDLSALIKLTPQETQKKFRVIK